MLKNGVKHGGGLVLFTVYKLDFANWQQQQRRHATVRLWSDTKPESKVDEISVLCGVGRVKH